MKQETYSLPPLGLKAVVPGVHRSTGFRDVARAAEIVRMREAGATLDAIGIRFDITRERVRQILVKVSRLQDEARQR